MKKIIKGYARYLVEQERAAATIQQYCREAERFLQWCGEQKIDRDMVLRYKTELIREYKPASANAKIAALNGFLTYFGQRDLRVKSVKIQRAVFCSGEREITQKDYRSLVKTALANHDKRLALLLETLCATGIRVSELRFITVEAVRRGESYVNCKGKNRTVLLPKKLCAKLMKYIEARQIKSGPIFVTRTGNPLDRSNIWKMLKALSVKAKVEAKKVFPHNLRHLFARCFYRAHHDLVLLADMLGHSSVDTTRIYTISTGAEHRKALDALGLVQ